MSGAAAAPASSTPEAAAAAAGPSTPAAEQRPILHQPYSHMLQCRYQFATQRKVYIAHELCTDIQELQAADGCCTVQVSFAKHPAGWDILSYILEHPVMLEWQQVQQMWPQQAAHASDPAASSTSQLFGPIQTTIGRLGKNFGLIRCPIQSIKRSLDCGAAPYAVVLQQRVSGCRSTSNAWVPC